MKSPQSHYEEYEPGHSQPETTQSADLDQSLNPDLALPAWGCYSKTFHGLSHLPDPKRGIRTDCSVYPALFRRTNTSPPYVDRDTGALAWECAPDHSYFSYKFDLADEAGPVVAEIGYAITEGGDGACFRATFRNDSELPAALALHALTSIHFPSVSASPNDWQRRVRLNQPAGSLWLPAEHYHEVALAGRKPLHAVLPLSGERPHVSLEHDTVSGTALRLPLAHGNAVDFVIHPEAPLQNAVVWVRYKVSGRPDWRHLVIAVEANGARMEYPLANGEWRWLEVPIGRVEGETIVRLAAASSGGAIQIDGLLFIESEPAFTPRTEQVLENAVPRIQTGPVENSWILHYESLEKVYGIALPPGLHEQRRFIRSIDPENTRGWNHLNGSRQTLRPMLNSTPVIPGKPCYEDFFLRPIPVPANQSVDLYGYFCHGKADEVAERLRLFRSHGTEQAKELFAKRRAARVQFSPVKDGQCYTNSMERMAAVIMTNMAYPMRSRRSWTRTILPGKGWRTLFSWDAGFTGIGLNAFHPRLGLDFLGSYLTDEAEEAPYVQFGSPVPVQIFQAWEWQASDGDRRSLEKLFPRLARMHALLVGRHPGSPAANLKSGLIRLWDIFLDTGDGDDYPAQEQVAFGFHEKSITPVLNTALGIRCARMLQMWGRELGVDTTHFEEDAHRLTLALQSHAWDESSGYFSYVRHNNLGEVEGFLDLDGVNANMGFDGVSPLIGGHLSANQEKLLLERIFDPARLWSPIGMTTVDQSAPYFRADEYWNGSVWMPHQWFLWKAMLDRGLADRAWQIASTALEIWRRETDASGRCFEHFPIATGRGAGWHQFGALSAPVLNWFGTYFLPGRITTGWDLWPVHQEWEPAHQGCNIEFAIDPWREERNVTVLATLAQGGGYSVKVDGCEPCVNQRHPGLLEITFPAAGGTATNASRVRLEITPQSDNL